jgi:hypothetical protein
VSRELAGRITQPRGASIRLMMRALDRLPQILRVRCTITAMDRHPEPVAKQPSADRKPPFVRLHGQRTGAPRGAVGCDRLFRPGDDRSAFGATCRDSQAGSCLPPAILTVTLRPALERRPAVSGRSSLPVRSGLRLLGLAVAALLVALAHDRSPYCGAAARYPLTVRRGWRPAVPAHQIDSARHPYARAKCAQARAAQHSMPSECQGKAAASNQGP